MAYVLLLSNWAGIRQVGSDLVVVDQKNKLTWSVTVDQHALPIVIYEYQYEETVLQ